jgi:hypothetical protein
MTPDVFLETALIPAFRVLPPTMQSAPAKAMILAICLQESKLASRRQRNGGPARGYAQFERAGIRGVLTHPSASVQARAVCTALDIMPTVTDVYAAICYQDVLTCAFARLLLWTDLRSLPAQDEPDLGWNIYQSTWRPGKPRRDTWNTNFRVAWQTIIGGILNESIPS